MKHLFFMVFSACLLLSGLAGPAWAYIGPGAGLGVIGSIIALAAAALVIILGLVVYPLRKLAKKRRLAREQQSAGGTEV